MAEKQQTLISSGFEGQKSKFKVPANPMSGDKTAVFLLCPQMVEVARELFGVHFFLIQNFFSDGF